MHRAADETEFAASRFIAIAPARRRALMPATSADRGRLVLHPFRIREAGGEVRISCEIENAGERREIWYAFNSSHARHMEAGRLDGFLVALLFDAMQSGLEAQLHGRGLQAPAPGYLTAASNAGNLSVGIVAATRSGSPRTSTEIAWGAAGAAPARYPAFHLPFAPGVHAPNR